MEITNEGKSLNLILKILWDKKMFVIGVSLAFMILGFLYGKYQQTQAAITYSYEAKYSLELVIDDKVENKKQVFIGLLESRDNINKMAKSLGVEGRLTHNYVWVVTEKNSPFLEVFASYGQVETAITFLDGLVKQTEKITNDVLKGIEIKTIKSGSATGNFTSEKQVRSAKKNTMVFLFLGFGLSVFIIYFIEFYVCFVKYEEDVEQGLKLELLTTLPKVKGKMG